MGSGANGRPPGGLTREGASCAFYRQGRRGRSSWNAAGLAREGDGEVAGLRDAVGGVSRRGVCGGAWQLDAEPGRSGLGELVLGEVQS